MAVNQVSNIVNTTSSVRFNEFKQPKNGYFIQPDTFTTTNNNEDKIDKKKLWIKLGIGALLVGLTSFGMFKAMPKSVIKKFDKFKQYLEKKVENEATNSKTAIFYRTMLQAAQGFGEKCQGINNVISFKDVWFQRQVTNRVPFVKRACNAITRGFDGISKATVKMYYSFSAKNFKNLDDVLSNMERELIVRDKSKLVTINGQTKSVGEWVKILAAKRQAVNGKLDRNFSATSVRERRKAMDGIMTNLEDGVWAASFGDKSNFRKKDTYFTFIADKFLAVDKAKLVQGVHKLRAEISYNLTDRIKACKDMLNLNKRTFNPKDTVSEKIYRDLNKQLSSLAGLDTASPQYAKIQEEIANNISALKANMRLGKDKYKYDDRILGAVDEHSRIMQEILGSSQKGTLDEMLEIYEKILPNSEFRVLQKQVNGAVKSLDTSINNECVEYFDKLRDLKLGSAPTDILTILTGFGTLGIGLASTDDKDTQASVLLKYGIPAIGGMLTSMAVTSMLVSGIKSHVVGFASSLVLNRLGVIADNARKKHNQEKTQNQNTATYDQALKNKPVA